jgi:hypothetical protein
MAVEMNADMQRLAEFMQREFPASQLISMASNISALAPLLWSKFGREANEAFLVTSAHSQVCDQHKPVAAT